MWELAAWLLSKGGKSCLTDCQLKRGTLTDMGTTPCPGPGHMMSSSLVRRVRSPGSFSVRWVLMVDRTQPASGPSGTTPTSTSRAVLGPASLNLAANPASTIAVKLPDIDLTFEGDAIRATEPASLEKVAALYRDLGWPAQVQADAVTAPYSAPSAGPPPWHLYRFRFHTVVGVATAEPNGATLWRFCD